MQTKKRSSRTSHLSSLQNHEDPLIPLLIILIFLLVFFLPSLGLDTYLGRLLGFKASPADIEDISSGPPSGGVLPPPSSVSPVAHTQGTQEHLPEGYLGTFSMINGQLMLTVLERVGYGKIEFLKPLPASRVYTADLHNSIQHNKVFFDTRQVRQKVFAGIPAVVTLYNIPFTTATRIIRIHNDGTTELCADCAILGHGTYFDGTFWLSFSVPEFSGYGTESSSPPGQLDVVLNATTRFNTTTDTLTCIPLGTFDPDGDVVVTEYSFTMNGVPSASFLHAFDINVSDLGTGSVKDFSGTSKDATLGAGIQGRAPQWVGLQGSELGGSYLFDGVNDFIRLDLLPLIELTPSLTLEAWVNMSAYTPYQVIIGLGNETAGYSLGVSEGNGNLFFAGRNGTSPANLFTVTFSSSSLPLFTYHHLAGVHDSVSGALSLYVDGVNVNSTPSFFADALSVTGGTFGSDETGDVLNKGSPGPFQGALDQLAGYPRALSADQIREHASLRYHTVAPAETQAGQVWSCTATPVDGFFIGEGNQSLPLTIDVNKAPSYSSVSLSSSTGINSYTEDFTCAASALTDREGNLIRNITFFTQDATFSHVLFLPFETDVTSATTRNYAGIHNASVQGATFNASAGILGGAYSFDGSDDELSVLSYSALDFGTLTNFSIDLWVKPALLQQDMHLLSKTDNDTLRGYSLSLRNGDHSALFRMSDTLITFSITSPANAFTADTYTHIALTVDRKGNTSLYIDGVLEASLNTSSGGSFVGDITTSAPLLIGTRPQDSSRHFNGTLDEVALYNYLLAPDQILNHYLLRYHVLNGTQTEPSQQWTCTYTPHDGYSAGLTTTSASITIFGVCGNDLTEYGEECDGSDDVLCPADCQSTCLCGSTGSSICGDGACGLSEDCSLCPGDCVCGDGLTCSFGACVSDDGSGSDIGGGGGATNTFVWDVNKDSSVTYTMRSTAELLIFNFTEGVTYEATISSIQHHVEEVTFLVYPTIPYVRTYGNETTDINLDLNGTYDISLNANAFSFDQATLTFSLYQAPQPSLLSSLPSLDLSSLLGLPSEGSQSTEAVAHRPKEEHPRQPLQKIPREMSPFTWFYVTLLLLLILVTLIILFHKVKHA